MKPRCAACDELIFSKEYTKAENQNWHLNHFCCWKCDKPLGGTKYIIIDSKPYCLECNNLNFSKVSCCFFSSNYKKTCFNFLLEM